MPSNWFNVTPVMPLIVSPWSWPATGQQSRVQTTGFSTSTFSGSNVLLYPVNVTEPYRVVRFWWISGGTAAGSIDCGVYDSSGALLVSAGSTVMTSNVVQQVTVDYTLSPGRYYVGFGCTSATAQFAGVTPGDYRLARASGFMQHSTASPVPLPSQVTLGSNLLIGLIPAYGFSRVGGI